MFIKLCTSLEECSKNDYTKRMFTNLLYKKNVYETMFLKEGLKSTLQEECLYKNT